MKIPKYMVWAVALLVLGMGCTAPAQEPADSVTPSGALVNGYRILTIVPGSQGHDVTVYRGDYIKFDVSGFDGEQSLSVPELNINSQSLGKDLETAPYFKMKTSGTFDFSIGTVTGTICVVEYRQPQYRELSSVDAAEFITESRPFIMDVRTPGEYAGGHIKDAVLIPVQQLQARLGEISGHRDSSVLIYCATGNRSTVASKILIDSGFKAVVNMRDGIATWIKQGYPVVR